MRIDGVANAGLIPRGRASLRGISKDGLSFRGPSYETRKSALLGKGPCFCLSMIFSENRFPLFRIML
jgi:hypothetical protein